MGSYTCMLHLVALPRGYNVMLDSMVRVLFLISVCMYPWQNVAHLFPLTSETSLLTSLLRAFRGFLGVLCYESVWAVRLSVQATWKLIWDLSTISNVPRISRFLHAFFPPIRFVFFVSWVLHDWYIKFLFLLWPNPLSASSFHCAYARHAYYYVYYYSMA